MNKKQTLALLLLRRRMKKKRIWIHPINLNRKKYGHFYALLPELEKDEKKFFNYFRMDKATFNHLLNLITPRYFLNLNFLFLIYYYF